MSKGEILTPVGRILREELALENKFFLVFRRIIETPDGETREQFVWNRRGKDFCVLLARTTDDKFILVEEPKYGQMKRMLTIPTGANRYGETLIGTAKRELLEETGYHVQEVFLLKEGVVDFPDKIDGAVHYLYFGINAQKSTNPPEQFRKVVELTREELEGLLDNKIADLELDIAMSLTTVMLTLRRIEKEDIK